MKAKTQCSHCGKLYFIDSEHLGKVVRCKKCHEYFEMAAYDGPSSEFQPDLNTGIPPQSVEASPSVIDTASPAPADEPSLPARPPMTGADPMPQPGSAPSPTQPVACPRCGYSTRILRTAGYLKARCPQCGARFIIKPPAPARPKATANWRGRGRPLQLALVLLLLLILLAGYFIAPALWPEQFPKSLSEVVDEAEN